MPETGDEGGRDREPGHEPDKRALAGSDAEATGSAIHRPIIRRRSGRDPVHLGSATRSISDCRRRRDLVILRADAAAAAELEDKFLVVHIPFDPPVLTMNICRI